MISKLEKGVKKPNKPSDEQQMNEKSNNKMEVSEIVPKVWAFKKGHDLGIFWALVNKSSEFTLNRTYHYKTLTNYRLKIDMN